MKLTAPQPTLVGEVIIRKKQSNHALTNITIFFVDIHMYNIYTSLMEIQ
jgi:hypothetical protein